MSLRFLTLDEKGGLTQAASRVLLEHPRIYSPLPRDDFFRFEP